MFGKDKGEVVLKRDTFGEAFHHASLFCEQQNAVFIHLFYNEKVIAGQGTVGLEILEYTQNHIDYLLVPIGGGGLAAGICTVFKQISPKTKIIGVEPAGASSLKTSMQNGANTTLEHMDEFYFYDCSAISHFSKKFTIKKIHKLLNANFLYIANKFNLC